MFRGGYLAAVVLCATSLPAAEVHYATDVAPLLEKRCYGCHGAGQQMSGLRLDQKDAAMRVIQPGNSGASRLIRMVTGADGKVMPPVGARLTAAQIAMLRAWIDKGAEWPVSATATATTASTAATHWSFRKITRPDVPAVRDRAWARNPIDNFILAKLDAEGIAPSPEASRGTLLRRVSLDLTGLPPSAEEVDEFLRDNRPDAYERVVDRLLASPHFGEKWARSWLDLARYADSDGYEKDRTRPWAWRYREWVIQALNRDMPFDEFTIDQLAGDLLPNRTVDTMVATGFNRNTLTNREGGTDPEQFRDEQVLDRAATLGTVWLGLTVGCAQCHDHKFDPIKQKEFYQLTAFFNTQEEVNIQAPMPGELGPYLEAKAAYDQKRRRCSTSTRFPRRRRSTKTNAPRGAAPRRIAGRRFRIRRIHPHGGQRAQGAVYGPGQAQRGGAVRHDRCVHRFVRQCLSQGLLQQPEAEGSARQAEPVECHAAARSATRRCWWRTIRRRRRMCTSRATGSSAGRK